jgi:hypothetical protein
LGAVLFNRAFRMEVLPMSNIGYLFHQFLIRVDSCTGDEIAKLRDYATSSRTPCSSGSGVEAAAVPGGCPIPAGR